MTIDQRHDTASEASERVRALLAAAGAPTESGPVRGESEALAAFRAAHPHERTRMLSSISPAKAALATSATIALVLAGGFSAAAAGALPGAAQDTAHDVLAKIGVTVPGPNEASDGHPDSRGSSGQDDSEETTSTEVTTSTEDTTDATETDEDSPGKGAEISELAKTTDATGVDKGAEISTAASGGKSQAGQHGAPADTPNGPPEEAGAPDDAGPPADAGKPDDPGKPTDAGKPAEQAPSPN